MLFRSRKGEFVKTFQDAQKNGFVRVRVDGETLELGDEIPKLDKQKKHTIEIVIDRLVIKEGIEKRLTDSLETALHMANGLATVDVIGEKELIFSQNYACDDCGISIEEMSPRMFSFNTPYGACPSCTGLGEIVRVDPDLVIPNKELSINQGAIVATGWTGTDPNSISYMYYNGMAKHYGFSLDTPVKDLPDDIIDILLYGTRGEKIHLTYDRKYARGSKDVRFEGIIKNLTRRHEETNSQWMKAEIETLMVSLPCPDCGGARLKKEVLAVTIDGLNIDEVSHMSISEALNFFSNLNDKFLINSFTKNIIFISRTRIVYPYYYISWIPFHLLASVIKSINC